MNLLEIYGFFMNCDILEIQNLKKKFSKTEFENCLANYRKYKNSKLLLKSNNNNKNLEKIHKNNNEIYDFLYKFGQNQKNIFEAWYYFINKNIENPYKKHISSKRVFFSIIYYKKEIKKEVKINNFNKNYEHDRISQKINICEFILQIIYTKIQHKIQKLLKSFEIQQILHSNEKSYNLLENQISFQISQAKIPVKNINLNYCQISELLVKPIEFLYKIISLYHKFNPNTVFLLIFYLFKSHLK